MENLDPQVQIRIIDLAMELTEKDVPTDIAPQNVYRRKIENFDKAYKAILKTIREE